MATIHTRTTDEQLLIQLVKDAAWDEPDLMQAAARLEAGIEEELEDYAIVISDED